jgi:hypothetical protein
MSAECYWCIADKAPYGNQLGLKGFPFACCHRCQVFTCGHHGQRDDGIQKFRCFDCDKTILIASAINIADLEESDVNEVSKRSGWKQTDLLIDDLFKSFKDFIRRRRGYEYYLDQIRDGFIDYNKWPDEYLKNTFRDFPDDAQKLLVFAAILIADTDSEEGLEKQGNTLFLNLKTSLKIPIYD